MIGAKKLRLSRDLKAKKDLCYIVSLREKVEKLDWYHRNLLKY